ncbi:siderophore ABC transporter substrate-binding protein [Bartonella sp. F02]|uniref:siderophore ABC transporter substrate-binding protein n=1 Tax=Bartonella sp. F02 TaxID=2967262 RepID=UPI0022A9684D|nr:siderophore ABC transporter substrate-binding protein [Bartonella sp. F02]MCZ2328972.1 siderophore ABC transporter substrate-binding protein [Bartonella sp. F02]
MTKYIRWTASILAAMMIFTTASWANTSIRANITIDHTSGSTAVKASPQKVIVFDLATLDNMKHLGIDAVVGVPEGQKPEYLSEFNSARYETIGTVFEPNYEKIINLQPDLIIITGRTQPKYKDLSQIAPTIDLTVQNKDTIKDIERNITILGQIFGKEKEATREIKKLHDVLADVRKQTNEKGTGLVLMTSGGKISALGLNSRFDIFHSTFGIAPATDKLTVEKHGQLVSPEFILEVNPDWLLVIDRDSAIGREGQSAAQLLDNALIKRTKAGAKNQIIYLNSWNWYRASGGLTGLYETAEQIREAFAKSK